LGIVVVAITVPRASERRTVQRQDKNGAGHPARTPRLQSELQICPKDIDLEQRLAR